jgi:hypothetical protein
MWEGTFTSVLQWPARRNPGCVAMNGISAKLVPQILQGEQGKHAQVIKKSAPQLITDGPEAQKSVV